MRKKFRSVFICLLMVVSVFTVIEIATDFIGEVRGATLYVNETGSGGAYNNIQDAIDAANPGDTVFVYSGNYYENVVVDKAIDLVGEVKESTIIDGSGVVVLVSMDWVNVTGFTVINSGGFSYNTGIKLDNVQNCRIVNNDASSNNIYGIYLSSSNSNYIANNTFSNNDYGIYLFSSSSINITNNTMVNDGIMIQSVQLDHWNTHYIDTLNTVNGKPVYYLMNQSDSKMPFGAGQVILANCTNITVENQNVGDGSVGILLGFSNSNTIANNNANSNHFEGIRLFLSDHNTIVNNNANSNNDYGIYLFSSNSNNIASNNASDNWFVGIYLSSSSNNTISNNNAISNFRYGIYLDSSINNNIANNNASNNDRGIWLSTSSNNTIAHNTVSNNDYGIYLYLSNSNSTIVNNTVSYNSYGIRIILSSNNDIINNAVSNNGNGISISSSSNNNTIVNNNASNNGGSISISSSSNNNTIGNNNISNSSRGIYLTSTISNNITNNNMVNSGIMIEGDQLEHWNTHDIDTLNTVNGKPVYYLKNQSDGKVQLGAGEVILVNCTNISVENQNVSNGSVGILIGFSNINTIANNTASSNNLHGIYLSYSSNNTIVDNTANSNYQYGIHLSSSSGRCNIVNNTASNNHYGIHIYSSSSRSYIVNNTASNNRYGIFLEFSGRSNITNNIANSNNMFGIRLHVSSNNTIAHNTVSNNEQDGIYLTWSSSNTITNNNASNNGRGISISSSSNNNIINNNTASNNYKGFYLSSSNSNNITNNNASSNNDNGFHLSSSSSNYIANNIASNNSIGIQLHSSDSNNIANNIISISSTYGILLGFFNDNNNIYHNYIIDNTNQAIDHSNSGDQWDNGYPRGGNYWSNYFGVDSFSGPNQDEPGNDGFGDTKYWVDGNSKDNYPLMGPIEEIGPRIQLILPVNNSVIQSGTTLDLQIYDEDLNIVNYSVDGGIDQFLPSPHDITTAGWEEGIHNVTVNASDLNNNSVSRSFSFTVDSTKPNITLISPLNNSIIPVVTLLDFSVSDLHLSQVSYSLNGGGDIPLSNPYDISTAGWLDGDNIVQINAVDLAGNSNSSWYLFKIDSSPPRIILNSPGNNSVISNGTFLNYSLIDLSLSQANYSINGGPEIPLSDPYDISTTGWVEGDHTVQINALDSFGNSNSSWFIFTIDSTCPNIQLNSPDNNSLIFSGVLLNFSIIDPHIMQVNYSLDGGPDTPLFNPFDVSTVGWPDGSHTVQINAVDVAGNSNSSWYFFTMESISPIIILNTPANNSHILDGVVLNFSVSDLNLFQVNYSVNGDPDISLSDPFDIPTSGWANGDYIIQINALDLAGNSNSSWYFFIIDNTIDDPINLYFPQITPKKGNIFDEFNYSVICVDPYGVPNIVNLSIDGINYTMGNYTLCPTPNGSDFHVNTYISNEQEDPAIVVYPNGSFVVVWSSWQGINLWGIYGQRYNSEGTKIGNEFIVEDIQGWERHPDITINPLTNDFVVVWEFMDMTGDYNIFMKIYSSDGIPKTSPIAVNTYTPSYQDYPSVACSNNGNIIVTWNSWEQDGDLYGIYAQRFDSDGNPLGSEFQVNTFTNSWQAFSDVVCLSNDRFIIVWMSYITDAIYGQKYYSNGNTWGSEFKISSTNGKWEQNPSIARDTNNNFVVVWKSSARSSGEEGVYFQRYSSAGNPLGGESFIAASPNSDWAECDVVCTSDNEYYVTWEAKNTVTGDWDVYIQKLESDGETIGAPLRVPDNSTNDQRHITICIDSIDRCVVVWHSYGMSDDSETGIYGKRFFNFTSRMYYFTTKLSHGNHTFQFYAQDDFHLVNTSILIGPYVDYPPLLTNPNVLPSIGNTSTIFNYTITYNDLDNNPPSYMKIEIDGSEHTMSEGDPTDVDFTDGKEYYYTTTLSSGSHNYKFFTSDGTTEINTSLFSGPLVDNVRPITSLNISNPKYGTDSIYVTADTLFILAHNNDGGGAGVAFTWYTIDDEYFEGTSFNLTGYLDGLHNITWGSMDNVGNNETGNSINISLDTAQPTIIFEIGEPNHRKYSFDSWNVTPFTLFEINSTDLNSGLNFTWYTIDGIYYEGDNFTLVGYIDGLHEIGYGAEDNVGNNKSESNITIFLDSNPPVTDLIPGIPRFQSNVGDNWNVSNITGFTFIYLDQYSGVKLTWYTIDGEYFEGTDFNLSGFNEGLHTITWGGIDYLGNNESGNLEIFNLDTSAPITNIMIDDPKFRLQETDNWNVTTSTEFSIAHNNDGFGSGINFIWFVIDGHFNIYSSPFTLTSGYHTLVWGGVDNLNLNTSGGTIEMLVDDLPPITNLTIDSPKYRDTVDDYWNVTDTTTFDLIASDIHSGVGYSWYSIDEVLYLGTNFTLSGYGEGLHSISWGSTDNLSNSETGNNIQVYLDLSPPVTTLSIGEPKYRSSFLHFWNVTSSTEFSLSSSDLNSGENTIWYTINGDFFEGAMFNIVDYDDGSYTISWGCYDNLDNNETGNIITVTLDKSPPATEINMSSPKFRNYEGDYWNVTAVTEFHLKASDNHSGINFTRYSIDGEHFEGTSFDLTGFTDGMHTITWESIDYLGNTEITNVLVIYLDETGPSISVIFGHPSWIFENTTYISSSTIITLEYTDSGAGVSEIFYSLDGGISPTLTYFTYESPFTVPPGTVYVTYYGKDNLNNVIYSVALPVIVDSADADGDEVPDSYDADDDNDSYPDEDDAFPFDAMEWIDTDGDGTGNNADSDDDGDGYLDEEDAFPMDFSEWLDFDEDGIGNNADPDDDNDGHNDDEDDYPLNPEKWKKSEVSALSGIMLWLLLLIIIIVSMAVLLTLMRKKGPKEETVFNIEEEKVPTESITEENAEAEKEQGSIPPLPPRADKNLPPPPPPPPPRAPRK